MEFKKELYFAAQAVEVWICNEQGQITFFDRECQLLQSLLAPNFPNQITR